MVLKNKKCGFTLAEVMITLSLIGALATLTISTVGVSIQQRARLSEFRTAYARMDAALRNISIDEGVTYSCYEVPSSTEKTTFGLNLEASVSANNKDCDKLELAFVRQMGATRHCPPDAGCIPANYPSSKDCFTPSKSYVLDNSMILMMNDSMKLFAIDINGRSAPNKWGQDIFPFSVKATASKDLNGTTFVQSIGILPSSCEPATGSKAGKTTIQMMKDSAGIKTGT